MFGSQARGDARPESDVDVLVVLRGDIDAGQEIERSADLRAKLSLAYDTVLSIVLISLERYQHENSPFLLNVRREAEALAGIFEPTRRRLSYSIPVTNAL